VVLVATSQSQDVSKSSYINVSVSSWSWEADILVLSQPRLLTFVAFRAQAQCVVAYTWK